MLNFKKPFRLLGAGKVRRQLYSIYFWSLAVALLSIGIFLIFYTRSLLLAHYQEQANSENLRVKSIMYDVSLNISNYSEDILRDEDLLKLLTTEHDTSTGAHREFLSYLSSSGLQNIRDNAAVAAVNIYTTNDTISNTNGVTTYVTDEIAEEDWYQTACSQTRAFWTSTLAIDSGGNEYYQLSLIRKIPRADSLYPAVMAIRVEPIYLKNRIQNTNYVIAVSLNDEPIFFSSDPSLRNQPLPLDIDFSQNYIDTEEGMIYKGNAVIGKLSTQATYSTSDYIYIVALDKDAHSEVSRVVSFCVYIILVAALIPFFIILLFTGQFTRRIDSLKSAMHMASTGDYEIKETFKGDDELSETFSDLQVMISNIKEKDAQIYQEKINKQILRNEQQKMEFKMLASQINPHFLYNTLETIRMQAFTAGNQDVANSIKLLGKSLHYVLENTGTASTTLKKEFDYIETYLAIQKLRFNDKLNYTFEVANDMDLNNYQILPLLLQPIVENAILHGLRGIETDGHLFIKVDAVDDEYLRISIKDTGIGMTPEELDYLCRRIEEKPVNDTSSIGLYNINQRIRLCYGDDYSMKIYSEINQGTEVLLILPLNCTLEE